MRRHGVPGSEAVGRRFAVRLVRIFNQQYGKTVVMATHDPKAAEYATRQLNVDKGWLFDGWLGTAA